MGWLERHAGYVTAHRDTYVEVFADMADRTLSTFQQLDHPLAASSVFDRLTWDDELFSAFYVRSRLTAVDYAHDIMKRFDPAGLDDFLLLSTRLSAENINTATEDAIQRALVGEQAEDELAHVFDLLQGSRADQYAESAVTTSANLGHSTAALQDGRKSKTWVTNSKNPRPAHSQLAGETVPIGEAFSNGMSFPGDPAGGADNNANCACSCSFG